MALTKGVHPRVCGEAAAGQPLFRSGWGPSPRVRGSRAVVTRRSRIAGSIPACAGKPGRPCAEVAEDGVHPRVCGEAAARSSAGPGSRGPSPRVRGSHGAGPEPRRGLRSIPACAGKPSARAGPASTSRVHPRVCGEAGVPPMVQRSAHGPSPRVRGSRKTHAASIGFAGSIPACAGKPRERSPPRWRSGVHPRVCGEAGRVDVAIAGLAGPSPRVRGSLNLPSLRDREVGSIPACAGKPPGRRRSRIRPTVHPRVCGEAIAPSLPSEPALGPSPRVRGSRGGDVVADDLGGSIPACAGKPRCPPC